MANILIVEDEKDIATLIKFLLEKEGHAVTVVGNGAEALERLGLEPKKEMTAPDLVVIDVMMPVMDGYSTCIRLAADPRTRGIPLIVLTAKSETRDIFRHSPNVAAYLSKPFDPQSLRTRVAEVLKGKSA